MNVGKYDAKNNETGIPGYYEDVDVDYLETDKDDDEVLEAAVLGYLPAVWYDDYAYIYDYTKTTTTGSKLDIYTSTARSSSSPLTSSLARMPSTARMLLAMSSGTRRITTICMTSAGTTAPSPP